MAGSQMVLHCGANEVTEEELREMRPPDPNGRWRPIPYGVLLDEVRDSLPAGQVVVRQRLAVTRDENRFFGVLDLNTVNSDYTSAVGLRSSWDKSMAAAVAFGSRVFVCDNLAFSAEVVFRTPHTTHILDRLSGLVEKAMGTLPHFCEDQDLFITKMKDRTLVRLEPEDLVVQAARKGIIPSSAILPVLDSWASPAHEEFAPATAWSLYNAFTGCQKIRGQFDRNPVNGCDRTVRLSKLFRNFLAS